jgi:hypothetical protein
MNPIWRQEKLEIEEKVGAKNKLLTRYLLRYPGRMKSFFGNNWSRKMRKEEN